MVILLNFWFTNEKVKTLKAYEATPEGSRLTVWEINSLASWEISSIASEHFGRIHVSK